MYRPRPFWKRDAGPDGSVPDNVPCLLVERVRSLAMMGSRAEPVVISSGGVEHRVFASGFRSAVETVGHQGPLGRLVPQDSHSDRSKKPGALLPVKLPIHTSVVVSSSLECARRRNRRSVPTVEITKRSAAGRASMIDG